MNAPVVQFTVPMKSVGLTYVLFIFLGGLGIHKFYLGRSGLGFLYIIMSSAFWFGLIGLAAQSSAGVMTAPWLIAVVYDLFTIPSQVRAANGRLVSDIQQTFGDGRPRLSSSIGQERDESWAMNIDQKIAKFAQEKAERSATVDQVARPKAGFGKR